MWLTERSVAKIAHMLSNVEYAVVDDLLLETNKGDFLISEKDGNLRVEYEENE